jgi:stage II sporulation protein M
MFKRIFIDNWSYTRDLYKSYKKVWLFLLITFFLGVFIVFLLPGSVKLEQLKSLAEKFENMSNEAALFDGIFANNLLAIIYALFFSPFLVSVPFMVFINGMALGIVSDLVVRLAAIGNSAEVITQAIAAVLPHGIIELPVVFTAYFLALLLGLKIIFKDSVEKSLSRRQFLKKVVSIYVFWLIPLLFIAAFIESSITVKVIELTEKINFTSGSTLNNDFLKAKTLSINDLSKVSDIKADISDIKKSTSAWSSVNILGTLIYDKELFELLKNNKPEMTSVKDFTFANKDNLNIQLSSFLTVTEEYQQIAIYNRFLTLMKDYSGVSLEQIPLGNGKVSYTSFGYSGLYTYYIRYDGNDEALFASIVKLQIEKLRGE